MKPVKIYRDGKLLADLPNIAAAWHWIHFNTSFSVAHAELFEGYKLVESTRDAEPVLIDRLETLDTLKAAAQWLGKMIADGNHKQAVMPNHCVLTLAKVEGLIDSLEKRATPGKPVKS